MNIEDYEKFGRARYERLAQVVEDILRHALEKTGELANAPQMQRRAKDTESLRQKLSERSLLASNSIENEIKDLAGCRIIFYTGTDLERFRNSAIWRENFEIDSKNSKTHFPRTEDASVDDLYQGIHYVVRLNAERIKLVEYADLAGMRCEIQLQTILNHAWSETSHDVLYKSRGVAGFGTKQREAIKKRFGRVMRDHLLQAGYEMEKIQRDAERLRAGEAIFDAAPLDRLNKAQDNNERVDILEQIKTHLLPGLDDISIYVREIREAVISAIEASRTVPVVARTGILGSFRGAKSGDVLGQGLEVLGPLRYGYVEESFQGLLRLWEGASEPEDRKTIEGSIHKIAKYSIPIWQKVGAGIQVALTEELTNLPGGRRKGLRPVVLEVCRAALAIEMDHAEATSYDAVTFSKGTVRANEALVAARKNAIALGLEILDASTTSSEWREAWSCLWSGTTGVSRGDIDKELVKLQLGLMRELCSAVAERRLRIPYDVLQQIEEDIYWAYRRSGGRKQDGEATGGEVSGEVQALKACRDNLNLDERYVTYKTLVGFRTVFPEEWDQKIEVSEKEVLRESRIDAYAAGVLPAARDYWLDIVVECAKTESDDLATFPPLTKFFAKISERQPRIALDIFLSGGKPLERFAPSFIPVLLSTAAREDTIAAMNRWLPDRDAGALGRALFLCDEPFSALIAQTGAKVIADKDLAGCFEIAHAAFKHGNSENELWATVLTPAVNTLTELGAGAFASSHLLREELESRLAKLPEPTVKALLDNFVCCREIGYSEQNKLAYLLDNHEELVWEMFRSRLLKAQTKSWEDRYEASPEYWHGLEKKLGTNVIDVFTRVTSWPEAKDGTAFWDKAGFLAHLYHACDENFVSGVIKIVQRDKASAIPFVCEVLERFEGNERIYPVCQAMVDVIPDGDDNLFRVRGVIEATGVTTGEFGRANVLELKVARLKPWLEHTSPSVQKFAQDFIDDLDKMIVEERRYATQRVEKRKRDFDDSE